MAVGKVTEIVMPGNDQQHCRFFLFYQGFLNICLPDQISQQYLKQGWLLDLFEIDSGERNYLAQYSKPTFLSADFAIDSILFQHSISRKFASEKQRVTPGD